MQTVTDAPTKTVLTDLKAANGVPYASSMLPSILNLGFTA
jgi:hypothetical protein